MNKKLSYILYALLSIAIIGTIFLVLYQGEAVNKPIVKGSNYTSEETAFLKLINDYRLSKGVPTLQLSDAVSDAADKHSQDMAKYEFVSHKTEKSDYFAVGSTPWVRMAASGYSYNTYKAENIAAGQSTAQIVFDDWKNSPGHNTNMLNPNLRVIGIGLVYNSTSKYKYYWTTDFGGFVDATSATSTTTTSTSTTTTTTLLPPDTDTTPVEQYFSDISPDFYAFKEIQYCKEKGYFSGYDDGTFRPYTNILVGHIHNILKDGDQTSYYVTSSRRYISDLLSIALYGKENFTLGLDDNVMRSQVAILLYSRDTGARVPSANNSLIGYLDKTKTEVEYIKKYASGAKLTCTPEELVSYYNKWAPKFGIRADFALAQAIKETGHFEYGGIVKWDANNFCGLSAGPGEPVVTFKTAELGVIAQLAHLACYAYPDHVIPECSIEFDPKHNHNIYKMLNPNGGSPIWSQLNGVWAVPGTTYAQDIAKIAARF